MKKKYCKDLTKNDQELFYYDDKLNNDFNN